VESGGKPTCDPDRRCSSEAGAGVGETLPITRKEQWAIRLAGLLLVVQVDMRR